jgi:hypothetical protein
VQRSKCERAHRAGDSTRHSFSLPFFSLFLPALLFASSLMHQPRYHVISADSSCLCSELLRLRPAYLHVPLWHASSLDARCTTTIDVRLAESIIGMGQSMSSNCHPQKGNYKLFSTRRQPCIVCIVVSFVPRLPISPSPRRQCRSHRGPTCWP